MYALVLLLKPRSTDELKAGLLKLLDISDDVQGAQKLCQARDWIRYVMTFGHQGTPVGSEWNLSSEFPPDFQKITEIQAYETEDSKDKKKKAKK